MSLRIVYKPSSSPVGCTGCWAAVVSGLQMLQHTDIFIVRTYPKPENGFPFKNAKRAVAPADADRVYWPLCTYALKVESMRLRVDLPQFVGSVCPTLHIFW